ncbi:hypothetical protein LTR85_002761 [Meristemomyces frigidus]|nr:hypothetical protein LTR85_002761 [Meristemomyces frigidus]
MIVDIRDAAAVDGTGEKPISFLIVAAELPAFCKVMQWTSLDAKSPRPVVTVKEHPATGKPQGIMPREETRTLSVVTHIQLVSAHGTEVTPALEAYLLQPFECMIIGAQKVQILGGVDVERTGALQALMGPRTTYLRPMAWRWFELVQDLKRAGDSLLSRGAIRGALDKYALVAETRGGPMVGILPGNYDQECEIPLALMMRIMMDATVTAGLLHLRLGDLDQAAHMVKQGQHMRHYLSRRLTNRDFIGQHNGRFLMCYQTWVWLRESVDILRRERPLPASLAILRTLYFDLVISGTSAFQRCVAHDIAVIVAALQRARVTPLPNASLTEALRQAYEPHLTAGRLRELSEALSCMEGFLERAHYDRLLMEKAKKAGGAGKSKNEAKIGSKSALQG